MARSGHWQDYVSFGGRVPWAVGLVLTTTAVLSLSVAFGSRHATPLFEFVSLRPAEVWHGEVWRLLTWFFVEPNPLGLIFACLALYWFGGDLAQDWESPYFLGFFGGVALAAAFGTCLIGLVDPTVFTRSYLGGWAQLSAMVVAWGLCFPDRTVRLFFVFSITGRMLAVLAIAITVALAVYEGWARVLPELIAEASTLAWLYRGFLLGRWTRARRVAARQKAQRLAREKRRTEGAAYARAVESDDGDLPPLSPDLERQIGELLGGMGKRARDGDKRKPSDDR